MSDPGFLLSAFATLLITVGPVETAAVFGGLTGAIHRPERRALARRAILFGGLFLGVFAVAGGPLLSILHISIPAFQVAGGVLLFLQALTLTFGNPGLSSISRRERREAQAPGDIAIFPLAFPIIAGPGALCAVVLLMSQAAGDPIRVIGVLAALAATLVLTYGALRLTGALSRLFGVTGADVVGRLSGVLLAALAMQFVFDGVRAGLGA